MEGFFGLLIVLAIGILAAGPVAVILAIVLFNRIAQMERRISRIEFRGYEAPLKPSASPAAATPTEPASPQPPPKPPVAQTPPKPATEPPQGDIEEMPAAGAGIGGGVTPPQAQTGQPLKPPAQMDFSKVFHKPQKKDSQMEVKIGISVALIVGVVTVMAGVAFFLKYIYENQLLSNVARVSIVAVGGFAALVIGEVIRRRQYGIVAKGITALGFALLYAAVFAGNKVYGLFDTPTAFAGAIAITAAAMIYAVGLNEMLIAFLSLLGGYLTPIIISTGRNLPIHLFGYVLVLSLGAMASAAFRRWRAINWMAFAGTYILYTLWFEKFYAADQMMMALVWLGVFGGLYLLLPMMHGLVQKIAARSEDVALIAVNAIVVFYYLWRILYVDYRQEMALAVVGIGAVHLVLAMLARLRCRDDVNLQAILGVAGTAFVTAAIGLYFTRLQPALLGWAVETVVLAFIAVRYRSLWMQAMSVIVGGIATGGLFYHLPLHKTEVFRVFLNEPFGIWLVVSLAILVCHFLWRSMRESSDPEAALLSQVYYVWGWLLLAVGVALEWYDHCDWHIVHSPQDQAYILRGMIVIAAILTLGFFLRPLCPKGNFVRTVGVVAAVGGAIFIGIAMLGVYYSTFTIFTNLPFVLTCGYVGAVLLSAWLVKDSQTEPQTANLNLPALLVLVGLVLFWVLLTLEIYLFWYCGNEYGSVDANWKFLAQMYISLAWAIYAALLLIIGFCFRARGIRYLSLLIFAVTLAKINLDIVNLRTEYRIATFLTTGLILVGVSFLYQFLKKKGFFDSIDK